MNNYRIEIRDLENDVLLIIEQERAYLDCKRWKELLRILAEEGEAAKYHYANMSIYCNDKYVGMVNWCRFYDINPARVTGSWRWFRVDNSGNVYQKDIRTVLLGRGWGCLDWD